ncbi:MAG: hypothetical protein WC679_00790 [Bacteroidales bacterium]|jgi:hypothetical protein
MNTIQQHEIDAQIETALQTKMRFGYTDTISVHKNFYPSGKVGLGFNFKQGVNVGDIYLNDDGTKCEVLALV